MKTTKLGLVLCVFVLVGVIHAVGQVTIAQWNFNSAVPDGNSASGSLLPSVGAGSASLIGGTTGIFAAGSPRDPASDNTAWSIASWPAQGAGSGTAGVQFLVSTVGLLNSIQISFDLRQSATASERFQLQATANGVNFTNVSGGVASFGAAGNNLATSFSNTGLYINEVAATNQAFVQNIRYTFAAGSAYENNPNFGFRLVSVFEGAQYDAAGTGSYAASGTLRIDLVGVAGSAPVAVAVPEPAVSAGWIVTTVVLGWALRRRHRLWRKA
jgi:hypothetical protein